MKFLIDKINKMDRQPDPLAGDMHSANASVVFPDFIDNFTSGNEKASKQRKIGKVMGLSLMYQDKLGLSPAYTVHYNEGIGETVDEALALTTKWYAGVPTFTNSIKQIMDRAKQTSKTYNLFGEVFTIPDCDHKNDFWKRKAMKKAINIPIQSSGSVQTKMMVERIVSFIETYRLDDTSVNLKL